MRKGRSEIVRNAIDRAFKLKDPQKEELDESVEKTETKLSRLEELAEKRSVGKIRVSDNEKK